VTGMHLATHRPGAAVVNSLGLAVIAGPASDNLVMCLARVRPLPHLSKL
jgi:hypothetical protein